MSRGLFHERRDAVAVGRFVAGGPTGFVARSGPFSVAAMRATREEAEADEREWRGAAS